MKNILMKSTMQLLVKTVCVCLLIYAPILRVAAQQNDLLKSTDVIKQHAAKIGLNADDLNNYRISDAYVDKLSGATIYYLQQTYKGIDVLNSIQTVAIKNNEVVSVLGNRIQNMQSRVNVKDGAPVVTSEDAVRTTARHLNINVPSFIIALKTMDDKKLIQYSDLGISSTPVRSKLIWLIDAKTKKASLSWQINVQPKGKVDHWLVHVDAAKGQVLGKVNLNISCTWTKPGDENNLTGEAIVNGPVEIFGENAINSASYRVVPFPAESPIHTGGTPALVSNPWDLSGAGNNATTLKWNDDGFTSYNYTRGNNVVAQEDKTANDGTGTKATSTTALPDLTFDFVPDFAQQPTVTVNQNFALTNLFYWNNIMHDLYYQYGFDEVSGNFQSNNQGRGGLGSDYVFADGLDGGSLNPNTNPNNFNNANFNTDADGVNPRMQMYLFTSSTIRKDGDLDNGVISHEFTHGISNRLTGGPSTASCLQNGEQMGEGWSDYIALMTTTNWNTALVTDGTKKRTLGTYVESQTMNGSGIRNYPYSTDILVDPWTYAKMSNTGGEPHNVGEVWCTMLWDMTWALIQNDGINKNIFDATGTGGNSVALKLVLEGMKLQTCSPGFVDGREGILKADTLLYGGKYSCIIWDAFRKRGLGYYASQGSSNYVGDEKADFTSAYLVKTTNKDSAAEQQQITYTLTLHAASCASITNYKIVDTLAANVTYVSSTGGTYNSGNRTVTFSNLNLSAGTTITKNIVVSINSGTYIAPVVHINEPFANNTPPLDWGIFNFKSNKWVVTNTKCHSAPYSLFAADADTISLTRFTTTNAYKLTNKSRLSFWHYYNTEETWDGGRVQISLDNGINYFDAAKYMVQNGYQSTIRDTTINNFRPGFSGNSGGFIKTILDFSSLAGDSIKIRFVYTSDEAVGAEGWYIDDIYLASESGVINIGQFLSNSDALVNNSPVYSKIISGSLPVTWGEFTAVKQGNTALLKWQTLQEINSSHFIIQRSTDGVNYNTLSIVTAAGNSSVAKAYQFTDQLPLNGKDYYRIAQVDKDGKLTYSPARTLEFLLSHVIKITPNPAKDKIVVTAIGNDKALKIYIGDATGKQVARFDMNGQYQQFNLPNLAAGVYYVKISAENVDHIQKLVIQ